MTVWEDDMAYEWRSGDNFTYESSTLILFETGSQDFMSVNLDVKLLRIPPYLLPIWSFGLQMHDIMANFAWIFWIHRFA